MSIGDVSRGWTLADMESHVSNQEYREAGVVSYMRTEISPRLCTGSTVERLAVMAGLKAALRRVLVSMFELPRLI
jgi:hypothetical protein